MYYIMSGFVPDFSRPQKMTLEFHQRFDCQPQSVKKLVQNPTSFIVGILYYIMSGFVPDFSLFTIGEQFSYLNSVEYK